MKNQRNETLRSVHGERPYAAKVRTGSTGFRVAIKYRKQDLGNVVSRFGDGLDVRSNRNTLTSNEVTD